MIYHLSHIDLDGFFCQYLSSIKYEKDEIKFYNSNYGPEIKKNLKKIMKLFIIGTDKLIITDLSLSNEEISFINELYTSGVDLKVYDHHENETLAKRKYNWMKLDTSISASQLYSNENRIITDITKYVNAYDIWDSNNEEYRSIGAVLSEIINVEPLFYLNQDKVEFFNGFFNKINDMVAIKSASNESTSEIFSNLFIEYSKEYSIKISRTFFSFKQSLAKKYVDDMKFEINKKVYVVFFELNREYFQYISSEILSMRESLIVCNFKKNGRVSFRSLTHDVNRLSKDYYRGGGHKFAAGGFVGNNISSREDSITYLKDVS
ncbi:MAG TPA: hypothetical protein EYG89_02345 [Bacteroidia bacterium]|nr:hypothetical protein [Bacteroidia bacterium]